MPSLKIVRAAERGTQGRVIAALERARERAWEAQGVADLIGKAADEDDHSTRRAAEVIARLIDDVVAATNDADEAINQPRRQQGEDP